MHLRSWTTNSFMDDKEVNKTKELLKNGNPLREEYVFQFKKKGIYRYCVLKLENKEDFL